MYGWWRFAMLRSYLVNQKINGYKKQDSRSLRSA